jgi:hypothetical protein
MGAKRHRHDWRRYTNAWHLVKEKAFGNEE